MMLPTNLHVADLINFVAGAAPAYATTAIIGAPSADERLRIWAAGTSLLWNVTAAALCHGYFQAADLSLRIPWSSAREANLNPIVLPGGVALPAGVGWAISATIDGSGGRTMPTWTAYTIEHV